MTIWMCTDFLVFSSSNGRTWACLWRWIWMCLLFWKRWWRWRTLEQLLSVFVLAYYMFVTLAEVSVSKQKYNAFLFTLLWVVLWCFPVHTRHSGLSFAIDRWTQFCDKGHRLVTDKLTFFFGGLIHHIYSLPHSNLKLFFFFFLMFLYTKLYDCFNRPTCSYNVQMFEVGITILCFWKKSLQDCIYLI